jgi:hypothetical protein
MTRDESKLPYHADVDLFGKMLDDLKSSGIDGINVDTLWANIGATKNPLRSFTLNLGRFVGLIDTDTKKIWLTDFGSTLQYMSKDERGNALASKLPEKYLTMFKWIRNDKELRSTEVKRKFIETWGKTISTSVLDRTVTTFLNYCDWLGIITYQGRGNQAKAITTDLGKRVLESPSLDNIIPKKGILKELVETKDREKTLELPKEATYPIVIKTNDRDFVWDIKSESDWAVVDSVIASIKEGWKIKQPENSSNHIKGKKDSSTTT